MMIESKYHHRKIVPFTFALMLSWEIGVENEGVLLG